MENSEIVEIIPNHKSNVALATLMQKRLAPLGSSSFTTPSIYMVPEFIRKENEDSYRPMVVSIGPIYYKKSTLETMQEVKWIYLNLFLQHPKNAHRNNLEHYIDFVREREGEIRQCYEEKILTKSPISNDDFIQMILLDAAFIICRFLENDGKISVKPTVPKNLLSLIEWVDTDLYLMENQLPFFILDDLYHSSFGSAFYKFSFTYIACYYVWETVFFTSEASRKFIKESDESLDPTSIKNLVDLYRMCCLHDFNLGDQERKNTTSDVLQRGFLTLKELQAAGVEIVASDLQLLLIEYENGVLKIPKISIDDAFESLLRNILYFEQCHCFKNTCIAAYVCFLDILINTEEDVEILVNNGILIDNGLGSNRAVADLINNLTKNIVTNDRMYYYCGVRGELSAYARKPWNRWRAILRRQYFKHPWAVISVIAAVILFILTTLQTIAGFTK